MILIRVNALLQKMQFQWIQPKEAVVPAAAQPPGSTVSEHFCRHVQVCSGQTVCRLTCHNLRWRSYSAVERVFNAKPWCWKLTRAEARCGDEREKKQSLNLSVVLQIYYLLLWLVSELMVGTLTPDQRGEMRLKLLIIAVNAADIFFRETTCKL